MPGISGERHDLERAGARSTWSALFELGKPGVAGLVMVTMLCGALVAPGPRPLARLLIAMFGTALVVASANALNMYIERDTDALMRRTASRPLPTGRLSAEAALWFALGCGGVGLGVLALCVNWLSAGLALLALTSYVLAYTPLKRSTSYALHVGAVPGAIPPLIGWASMTGSLAPRAFPLFLILLIWQLPHFLAIATFRREEYARAGLVVQPNAAGLEATRRSILVWSALLLAVSLTPLAIGMAGFCYGMVAVALGVAFFCYAAFGRRAQTPERWAKTLFLASLPYLVLVYAALVVSAM
ncbi:MAG TPA: heme o synthase [Polyangiaceae bacterium]|nr:heme o synthase [Polyangiaceae bacterium]